MDAVLRPPIWALPAPPVGGGSLAQDALQLQSLCRRDQKQWVDLQQDEECAPSLCPDSWRRHLEPRAPQEISEVDALSCLILLGLCQ